MGNSRKQSPFNSFRLGWIQSAQTVISTSPAGLLESRQPWSNREENKNEMSFRFQRRIRLATGLHLNVSKSGVGFSAGPRGFHVGVDSRRRLDSRRRPYVSAGIPGTGLSWREYPDQQRPEGVKDRRRETGVSFEQEVMLCHVQKQGCFHRTVLTPSWGAYRHLEIPNPDRRRSPSTLHSEDV